jgi:putative peptide zinc metalloprotease protein
MIISFAGIYVELVIASIATFVWWNTPSHPFINNLSLSLMVVCSVSTVMFNGNPLMRYDGYYVLADWIEIPNLRDRCNRFLRQIFLEHCLGVEVHREAYMALGRRILFVVYAVVSYVYKWLVTFGVLYFMYMFLRPYKLGAVSALLAAASLGSMVGWPLWQFGQNYMKRGRLPDMKPVRVSITSGVAVVLLLIFFFVPLPVSRVRQTAVVQVEPLAVDKVFVPSSNVILKQLLATNGQMVQKNDKIAVFSSSEIDEQLEETNGMVEILKKSIASLQQSRDSINDLSEKSKLERDMADRKEKLDINQRRWLYYRDQREKLEVLAPRTGMVYGLPEVEEIGKTWEQDQQKPFCSVGDPDRLEVLVPVVPADYHLLGEDLNDLFRRGYKSGLSVTIRVQGRGGQTWAGRVTELPQSDAKEVPAALTAKHGGPLAVKPGTNPNVFVPQSQNYLVAVAFDSPDRAICPGTLAQVKIHCRWHSCAWWAWRTISQTFDLGLI